MKIDASWFYLSASIGIEFSKFQNTNGQQSNKYYGKIETPMVNGFSIYWQENILAKVQAVGKDVEE